MNERQEENASLYVHGALAPEERQAFERELESNAELRDLVRSLRETAALLAQAVPRRPLPAGLKEKVLQRIDAEAALSAASPTSNDRGAIPGFSFLAANDDAAWKALPIPGAWIKLLSVDRAHHFVVLLGKLNPGVRYPAHTHEGSEDLYLLTGDLHIGDCVMRAGDFHHSDAGTSHAENYSAGGCTLLAILSTDHALAQFALAG